MERKIYIIARPRPNYRLSLPLVYQYYLNGCHGREFRFKMLLLGSWKSVATTGQ